MNKGYEYVLGWISQGMVALAMSAFLIFPTSSSPTKYTNWEFVCEVRQVDCSDIPAPIIVPIEMGPYGMFRPDWDPKFIFINAYLDPIQKDVVIAHETSHYLDWKLGRIEYTPGEGYDLDTLCISEAIGFNVSNAYVQYMGYDQSYGWLDWIIGYPHCQ